MSPGAPVAKAGDPEANAVVGQRRRSRVVEAALADPKVAERLIGVALGEAAHDGFFVIQLERRVAATAVGNLGRELVAERAALGVALQIRAAGRNDDPLDNVDDAGRRVDGSLKDGRSIVRFEQFECGFFCHRDTPALALFDAGESAHA